MFQCKNQDQNKLILIFNTQPNLPGFQKLTEYSSTYFWNCVSFFFGLTPGNLPFFHVYSLFDISNFFVKTTKWSRAEHKSTTAFTRKQFCSPGRTRSTSTTIFLSCSLATVSKAQTDYLFLSNYWKKKNPAYKHTASFNTHLTFWAQQVRLVRIQDTWELEDPVKP